MVSFAVRGFRQKWYCGRETRETMVGGDMVGGKYLNPRCLLSSWSPCNPLGMRAGGPSCFETNLECLGFVGCKVSDYVPHSLIAFTESSYFCRNNRAEGLE